MFDVDEALVASIKALLESYGGPHPTTLAPEDVEFLSSFKAGTQITEDEVRRAISIVTNFITEARK